MNHDSLENLKTRLSKFAEERDWDQYHSPKNLSMALIAEAAELVEHFQWLTQEQSSNLSADKVEPVEQELADILIYLVRISDKWTASVFPVVLPRGQASECNKHTSLH